MADRRRIVSERLPVPGGSPAAVARVVNRALDGHLDNVGQVTLEAGTTSTVVMAPIFRASTVLILVPTTSAGAAIAWWQPVTQSTKNAITVEHDAPAGDAVFLWAGVG